MKQTTIDNLRGAMLRSVTIRSRFRVDALILLFAWVIFLPLLAYGHNGGRDDNGGHYDRKSNVYHCHTPSCLPDRQGRQYSRKAFGGWADSDADCQNTRAELLIARSLAPVSFATAKRCRVVSGRWIDAYTGKTITDASLIDIDHVIPLREAWVSGADSWASGVRIQFANDDANLAITHRSINRSKGAKDLGRWLPAKGACAYVMRWSSLKATYGLAIDASEARAITEAC